MTTHSASAVTVRDVAYWTTEVPLLARIYRPPGPGPFPAVIGVHGGRWCAEDRMTNAVIDSALAAAGILVLALDFRMPPTAQYPASLTDINFAVRWLKARAADLEVDPARVGAVGTSSGGHQVMVAALRPDAPEFGGLASPALHNVDASLSFVVACWAVLDPLARYRYAKQAGMTRHVESHDLYWPDEWAMAAANPQLILERKDYTSLPPTLILHGTADVVVPCAMAIRFADRYRLEGGSVDLAEFADQPHTFILKDPASRASGQAIAAIITYVKAHASG